MRRAVSVTVGLISAAALIAGCTSGSDGQSGEASRSSAATSSSATGALDTGTFSTTARGPFGTKTIDDLPALESQRLAEFTTLPQEIDSRFTQAALPFGATVNRIAVNDFLGGGTAVATAAIQNKMGAGFYASAGQAPQKTEPVASMTHGVMRFKTPADAARGAQAIFDALLASKEDRFGGAKEPAQKITIPSLPNSLVLRQPNATLPGTTALTAHSSYVIADLFVEPTNENNAARDLKRSLDLQIPLLDKFPLTKTGPNAQIVQDQNKILIYTLPNPKARTALNDGVFGPRGFAFAYDTPLTVIQQLKTAGVEHIASAGSNVFRAATPEQAQQLMADRIAFYGGDAAASPPGLSSAKCTSDGASNNHCWIANGRYLGEVQQQDLKTAQQAISAEYKILQSADQNQN